MAELKLIKEDTDLSILRPIDWDVVLGDMEYQVYRAPGFIHTIGGRWGENDYWAAPRMKEPTFHNLIEFNGVPVMWGITIQEKNHYECKYDEPEMRSGCGCHITRNGKPFYSVGCSDIAYGYAEAYRLLRTKIQEGPINFNAYRYWDKEIEYRHINYNGLPYTLYLYMHGQCCAMAAYGWLTPEEIEKHRRGCGDRDDLKLDLLADSRIEWSPDSRDDETD